MGRHHEHDATRRGSAHGPETYSPGCVEGTSLEGRLPTSASLRAILKNALVGLGDASVYLVDLKELRPRWPPCSFQVLLKRRVVHHLLKVFCRLPHVDNHHA